MLQLRVTAPPKLLNEAFELAVEQWIAAPGTLGPPGVPSETTHEPLWTVPSGSFTNGRKTRAPPLGTLVERHMG